jgi:hypothetical protein
MGQVLGSTACPWLAKNIAGDMAYSGDWGRNKFAEDCTVR